MPNEPGADVGFERYMSLKFQSGRSLEDDCDTSDRTTPQGGADQRRSRRQSGSRVQAVGAGCRIRTLSRNPVLFIHVSVLARRVPDSFGTSPSARQRVGWRTGPATIHGSSPPNSSAVPGHCSLHVVVPAPGVPGTQANARWLSPIYWMSAAGHAWRAPRALKA